MGEEEHKQVSRERWALRATDSESRAGAARAWRGGGGRDCSWAWGLLEGEESALGLERGNDCTTP